MEKNSKSGSSQSFFHRLMLPWKALFQSPEGRRRLLLCFLKRFLFTYLIFFLYILFGYFLLPCILTHELPSGPSSVGDFIRLFVFLFLYYAATIFCPFSTGGMFCIGDELYLFYLILIGLILYWLWKFYQENAIQIQDPPAPSSNSEKTLAERKAENDLEPGEQEDGSL